MKFLTLLTLMLSLNIFASEEVLVQVEANGSNLVLRAENSQPIPFLGGNACAKATNKAREAVEKECTAKAYKLCREVANGQSKIKIDGKKYCKSTVVYQAQM